MATLAPSEIDRYHRDGWLVPRFRLPVARVAQMREALEALRPVDRTGAHADADTALSTTLAEFERHDVDATGEITSDDPMPTLVEEVARLGAREVVVVTEPHAVEDTFHRDWASRAREALGVPVLHMYAGDWRLG
jgi:hypothetical protein